MAKGRESADTREFWEGIDAGEFRLQRCVSCEQAIFYPRVICPHCHSDELRWAPASGTGTVYAVTVVHRTMGAFASSTPYTVALVDLAEGPRMVTRIVGERSAAIGDRVVLEITEVDGSTDGLLPCFRVVASDD